MYQIQILVQLEETEKYLVEVKAAEFSIFHSSHFLFSLILKLKVVTANEESAWFSDE